MDNKRMIVAIALSVGVLVLWQVLFPPKQAPEAPAPAKAQAAQARPGKGKVAPAVPAAASAALPAGQQAAAPAGLPETLAARQEVKVDRGAFRAVVDTKGGVLRSFVLPDYRDVEGNPTELVPQKTPDSLGAYLGVRIPSDREAESRVNRAVYALTRQTSKDADNLVLHYQGGNLSVDKTISFRNGGRYEVSVSVRVLKNGAPLATQLQIGPGLTNKDLVQVESYQLPPHAASFDGSSVNTLTPEKVNDWKTGSRHLGGPFNWAGVQTKFFAALAIGGGSGPVTQAIAEDGWWGGYQVPNDPKRQGVHVISVLVPMQDGKATTLYLGPKSYQVMGSVRDDLTQTMDYGWLRIIVIPLYKGMRLIQSFIPNMGLCLLVLTLLISLATFPLRIKQLKSMKEMQRIQPQMKAIQAKYKNQKSVEARQRMNEETMKLYKEAGVNPMAGCLPLLVQMPFLFAFYRLIDLSIEFLHQPFALWIKDMSVKDPTYITPLIMGASMIIQMKQTPQAPGQDATQQKMMMYMMPIVMTFIFVNQASGLVIYFLFSNIFSWLLQKGYEKFFNQDAKPKAASARKSSK